MRRAILIGRLLPLALLGVLPAANSQPATPLAPGLVATATDGERQVVFLRPTPNFTLLARQTIHPQLLPTFRVTWEGVLRVPRTGRFTLFADAEVRVDGRPATGQPVALEAGERALHLSFIRREDTVARLQLQWESEFFTREPVPPTALGHRSSPALTAAEATARPGADAPLQLFDRLVQQLNCIECHELYGPARRTLELAETPPSLTDAGNKLRASWLEDVLVRNRRVRPWMKLEPQHHGEAARPLVNLFAQQAGAEPGEGATVPAPSPPQVGEGVKLLGKGEGGLACINCHDFAGHRSAGDLRGPDLTEMHARVRTDWLRRWLRDPGRLQPGTAMPAFFSELPAAPAERMIATLVTGLAAGRLLPLPEGLLDAAQDYRLLVRGEPVVFRTFIADSSSRSIAVGLPGGVNYVFDAEQSRVRYAWSGEFLDVRPVWTGRGGQPAIILGPKFYVAPAGHPLRVGNPATEPQTVFRGYRLVRGAPEFQFEVDGVAVRQRVSAAGNGRGLSLEFDLGPTPREVWFVSATDPAVTISSDAGAFENGRLRVPGGALVRFQVTVVAK